MATVDHAQVLKDIGSMGIAPEGHLKAPMSIYLRFRREFTAGKKAGTIPKDANDSEAWKALSDEKRKEYQAAYDSEKVEYKRLIAKYPHLKRVIPTKKKDKDDKKKKTSEESASKSKKKKASSSSPKASGGGSSGPRRLIKKRKLNDDLLFQSSKVQQVIDLDQAAEVDVGARDMINKATESFVHYVCDAAVKHANKDYSKDRKDMRKTLKSEHFESAIKSYQSLHFLHYTLLEGGEKIPMPPPKPKAPPKPKKVESVPVEADAKTATPTSTSSAPANAAASTSAGESTSTAPATSPASATATVPISSLTAVVAQPKNEEATPNVTSSTAMDTTE